MPTFEICSYMILNKQSIAILFIMSMRKKCTLPKLFSNKTFLIEVGNAAQISLHLSVATQDEFHSSVVSLCLSQHFPNLLRNL